MVTKRELTDKQKLFVDEYIISLNATESYKKAYPDVKNDKTATSSASRLLRNANVRAHIDERLKELDSEKIATQEEVLKYLTSVMRGEYTEETLIGRGSGYQEITKIAVSAKDRLKAADLLNKVYQAAEPDSTTSDSIIINFNGVGRDES